MFLKYSLLISESRTKAENQPEVYGGKKSPMLNYLKIKKPKNFSEKLTW